MITLGVVLMNIFKKADILIPKDTDYKKWSVVACDQYTSEPDYWESVEKEVGEAPSALKIVFPEIYLKDEPEKRIANINKTMEEYLSSGIFKELSSSLVLVERTQRDGRTRTGIVGMVDLEEYSFTKGEGTPIRATEGTVLERIPPRVKIRENAPLELPHILLLIDDENKTVVEPLKSKKEKLEKVYDFDLLMNSGHLTGYKIEDADEFFKALDDLASVSEFKKKYDTKSDDVLLFAVGDGNHSLATAKTCWDNLKKSLTEEERKTHPARFALVEVMNIHDEALESEPIHRVVFGVNPQKMIDEFLKFYPEASTEDNGGQHIKFVYENKEADLYVKNSGSNLAVGSLQNFIDYYIKEFGGEVDYIHGEEVVRKLSGDEGNIGFLLPSMEKNELFPTIIKDGALPRKTFSMGEAWDKRFYLEAKKIR